MIIYISTHANARKNCYLAHGTSKTEKSCNKELLDKCERVNKIAPLTSAKQSEAHVPKWWNLIPPQALIQQF